MTQAERPKSADIAGREPKAVKLWTEEIERKWLNIPDFKIDENKLKHLAVICDGNRRAAERRGLPSFWGHRAGIETIKGLMKAGEKWGINTLTFWVWSTENWQRDEKQVGFVMNLASKFLKQKDFTDTFIEHETRFIHLGRKDRLPTSVQEGIGALEKRTANFDKRTINLAMDYGGIDEVARAVTRLVRQTNIGRFNLDDLERDPGIISGFLDTDGQDRPDLVIRTGTKPGEIPHTSGFMPLQTTYAGWEFIGDLFPELTPKQVITSLEKFTDYKRRMGE